MDSEICCRERHLSEHTARIAYCRLNALFVGNVEFRCADDKLSRAHKSDNRENSDRNSEISLRLVAKIAAHLATNAFGNITARAAGTATAALLLLDYSCAENNRLNHLKHCLGKIVRTVYGLGC